MTSRRRIIALLAVAGACPSALRSVRAQAYPDVLPERPVTLPDDEGSHPAFRTEWWYATGWLRTAVGAELGFQVTFFRVRNAEAEDNPSPFAARQLLLAHAALADPARGRLLHDQRAARTGFGLAEAAQGRLDVVLDDWSLRREGDRLAARVRAAGFGMELRLVQTQPALLQGPGGVSRKGADARSASYYYSLPQLRVEGRLDIGGQTEPVSGRAWFDHEWSSRYVGDGTAGWDWIGINLADGGALMAFRMRGDAGRDVWAAATLRDLGGRVRHLPPDQVRFRPLRSWRSPRTGTAYPVVFRVEVADRAFLIEPLMDDQELDSRATTGMVYWEGAVRARDDAGNDVGRGYLELTGYGSPLRL